MKIKLISPRVTMRPMDSAWKTQMSPPLGLLVLGALTPMRHQVTVQDENVEKLRLDDNPDVVGIGVKVDTMKRAAEIARQYRRRGILVIMGGIHATACPEECAKHADSVVVGEAEEIWPELLKDAEDGRLKKVYRNDGPVNIAKSPTPDWSLLKKKSYLFTNTLTIGRGCPWRCSFCYNSSDNIDARYRMKPTSNILAEIESLGTKHVMFIDDNFIGNPKRVKQLLPEFKRMGLTWHTAVSADIGRHEHILDQMAESGCKSLFIGFETVNQKNLLHCHKTQNRIDGYDDIISKIHERGMMVNASVVFGFDGDDPSVFATTAEWLISKRVATMTAHILTPYPGTRLYKRLEEEGRIIDRDLDHYNTAHAVFAPNGMSAEDLERGYLWTYDKFYSWSGILQRWPVARGQALAYLQFQLLYRKFGKQTAFLGRLLGMRNMAKLAKTVAYPPWRRHTPETEARDQAAWAPIYSTSK
ncbi:MAG: radical SAM protein [Kiritimatiellia bacterium]|nr:radical SAM protein [Kiritimatiellia bacterium]